jgi:hypothetical protein
LILAILNPVVITVYVAKLIYEVAQKDSPALISGINDAIAINRRNGNRDAP